ncbi:MAG: transcriptional regulator, Crp/Fnr family [Phenylobacterium sp.]|jgi:CRP/FNR family cyclic AMP-dependent transcriptional regulator|uniref:Crp/Fnr family transcriptional regulator n=1 Tax=Phenylobacterium sp. TaxID=1871053 RepID=UPI00262E7386|nr:Crp/Fnr family transcriptional regulator [Phenylobacterium sp.]MDB5426051.1 transcriptional regulator, Crp/Fnr family [Phenylobacterium sp.]MDB5436704.1 transcriptional regulator, Crp/Fnr family [Phenylobacterium sp.]MDB5498289.1 transcriptional regulator, Crp/Fnr family [Phenylobacterium sp.]
MASPAKDSLGQVLAALKDSEVLGVLSPAASATLAGRGVPVDLAGGAYLCRIGDPGDAVYVILDGEIEVRTSSPGGRDLRLVALRRGEIAGEMAALDGGLRSADMVAARRTRLWRIPRSALIQALESEPKAAVALLAEMSARLRRTNAALEARATLDLGGRLAQLLVGEQNPRALIALTQSELARRLGASREKVNRKLHDWGAKGWVEVTPAGVRLLQPGQLEDLGKQAPES